MLFFTFSNPLQNSREIINKIRDGVWLTTSKEVCRGKFEKDDFQKQTESLYNIITTIMS